MEKKALFTIHAGNDDELQELLEGRQRPVFRETGIGHGPVLFPDHLSASPLHVRPEVLDGREVGVHGLVEVDGQQPGQRVTDKHELEVVLLGFVEFCRVLNFKIT